MKEKLAQTEEPKVLGAVLMSLRRCREVAYSSRAIFSPISASYGRPSRLFPPLVTVGVELDDVM